MSRICPLFSGSSGNCTYIGQGDTHILIDAGVSAKRITDALKRIGVGPEQLSAIFVTHEHTDHIKGIEILSANHDIPIYMSQGTADTILNNDIFTRSLDINVISSPIHIGDLEITRFPTSHDCTDSSGYRINLGDKSFAVCTDTGVINDTIRNHLEGCELVMLESNYDTIMLSRGPYPLHLKKRILSDTGHLSNTACSQLLPELLKKGTVRFILAHLSQHNNDPEVAYNDANTALLLSGYTEGIDYTLYIAPPEGGKLISL